MTETIRRADPLKIEGRILILAADPQLIRRQLTGDDLPYDPDQPLVDNISTDEIAPGWVCFYYDETLGHYSLVGLREGSIQPGDLAAGGFDVVVSGLSKGCGSSRETAPYSELWAGVKLVIARSIEKIYGQNAQNIGLLTSTDYGLIDRIRAGEAIPLSEFTRGLDPISTAIVLRGGLFPYNRARLAGEVTAAPVQTGPRPMTLAEKILASKAVVDARDGSLGLPAVRPGDAFFVRTDIRFSHDYTTAMGEALFHQALGPDARVTDPGSVFAFRDHLTFIADAMAPEHKAMGLLPHAEGLGTSQRAFARVQGIRLYDEVETRGGARGSEAICHNAVLEDLALPGQVVCGTDSHTCTAGALGCFAFGVGTTDMANAWYTKDVRVRVPETVRFELTGTLREEVVAKDVILHILATPFVREGGAIGKVLEFVGEGLGHLSFDERATLTNMAVEAGGFTGVVEPDEVVTEHLLALRPGLDRATIEAGFLASDPEAEYAARFEIRLDEVATMVAPPGDPRSGVPLASLPERPTIDIAYGGSCTGGKMADMDLYASVLGPAVERGLHVAEGVEAWIQFGSQRIRQYAVDRGYVELFEAAGFRLIEPSCGACINAGPGTSRSPDQVTVSAINRNFPGRSGPGLVWLASPLVVAASAIAGRLASPSELW